MAARLFRVGDTVCGVPPNLDYWWPAQVADISHAPEALREELDVKLKEHRDGVLLHYLGSPTFEYAVCENQGIEFLREEADLALLFVPSTGKNRKHAMQAIGDMRQLLRQRLHLDGVSTLQGAQPRGLDLGDHNTWPADLRERALLPRPRTVQADECAGMTAVGVLGALLAAARRPCPLHEELAWARLVYYRNVAKGEQVLQQLKATASGDMSRSQQQQDCLNQNVAEQVGAGVLVDATACKLFTAVDAQQYPDKQQGIISMTAGSKGACRLSRDVKGCANITLSGSACKDHLEHQRHHQQVLQAEQQEKDKQGLGQQWLLQHGGLDGHNMDDATIAQLQQTVKANEARDDDDDDHDVVITKIVYHGKRRPSCVFCIRSGEPEEAEHLTSVRGEPLASLPQASGFAARTEATQQTREVETLIEMNPAPGLAVEGDISMDEGAGTPKALVSTRATNGVTRVEHRVVSGCSRDGEEVITAVQTAVPSQSLSAEGQDTQAVGLTSSPVSRCTRKDETHRLQMRTPMRSLRSVQLARPAKFQMKESASTVKTSAAGTADVAHRHDCGVPVGMEGRPQPGMVSELPSLVASHTGGTVSAHDRPASSSHMQPRACAEPSNAEHAHANDQHTERVYASRGTIDAVDSGVVEADTNMRPYGLASGLARMPAAGSVSPSNAVDSGLSWQAVERLPVTVDGYDGLQLPPENVPMRMLYWLYLTARDPVAAIGPNSTRPDLLNHTGLLMCRELCFSRSHLATKGVLGPRAQRLLRLSGHGRGVEEVEDGQRLKDKVTRADQVDDTIAAAPLQSEKLRKRRKMADATSVHDSEDDIIDGPHKVKVRADNSPCRDRDSYGMRASSTVAGVGGARCGYAPWPSSFGSCPTKREGCTSMALVAPKLLDTQPGSLMNSGSDQMDLAEMEKPLRRIVDLSARCPVSRSADSGITAPSAQPAVMHRQRPISTVSGLQLSSLVNLKSSPRSKKHIASAADAGGVAKVRPEARLAVGHSLPGVQRPQAQPQSHRSSTAVQKPQQLQPRAAVQGQMRDSGSGSLGRGPGDGSCERLLIWFGKEVPMPAETTVVNMVEVAVRGDPTRRPVVKMDCTPGQRFASIVFPQAGDAGRLEALLRYNGCRLLKVPSMQNVKVERTQPDAPLRCPWPQLSNGPSAAFPQPSQGPWSRPNPIGARLPAAASGECRREGSAMISAKLPPRAAPSTVQHHTAAGTNHIGQRCKVPSEPLNLQKTSAPAATFQVSAPAWEHSSDALPVSEGGNASGLEPLAVTRTPAYIPLYDVLGGQLDGDEKLAPWLIGGLYSPSRGQGEKERLSSPAHMQEQRLEENQHQQQQKKGQEQLLPPPGGPGSRGSVKGESSGAIIGASARHLDMAGLQFDVRHQDVRQQAVVPPTTAPIEERDSRSSAYSSHHGQGRTGSQQGSNVWTCWTDVSDGAVRPRGYGRRGLDGLCDRDWSRERDHEEQREGRPRDQVCNRYRGPGHERVGNQEQVRERNQGRSRSSSHEREPPSFRRGSWQEYERQDSLRGAQGLQEHGSISDSGGGHGLMHRSSLSQPPSQSQSRSRSRSRSPVDRGRIHQGADGTIHDPCVFPSLSLPRHRAISPSAQGGFVQPGLRFRSRSPSSEPGQGSHEPYSARRDPCGSGMAARADPAREQQSSSIGVEESIAAAGGARDVQQLPSASASRSALRRRTSGETGAIPSGPLPPGHESVLQIPPPVEKPDALLPLPDRGRHQAAMVGDIQLSLQEHQQLEQQDRHGAQGTDGGGHATDGVQGTHVSLPPLHQKTAQGQEHAVDEPVRDAVYGNVAGPWQQDASTTNMTAGTAKSLTAKADICMTTEAPEEVRVRIPATAAVAPDAGASLLPSAEAPVEEAPKESRPSLEELILRLAPSQVQALGSVLLKKMQDFNSSAPCE